MRIHSGNPHLRLAVVFCVLVLVPSALLGWFSLRAVESERRASRLRRLADRAGYAEFASRAVQQELGALEAAWEALVPRSVGWERQPGHLADALEAARGHAFVQQTHLLHVSGARLDVGDGTQTGALPAWDAKAARSLREMLRAAEAAEVDAGDLSGALQAYRHVATHARAPVLVGVALARITRIHLQLGNWDAALQSALQITSKYADVQDFDNRSLRLHAKLQAARALEESADLAPAAATLVDLREDLLQHSDEIGQLQFDLFAERVAEHVQRLRDRAPNWAELAPRWNQVRGTPKKPIGREYFSRKLMRKLVRAALDGQAYSTRVRYLSDTADGEPFLLAYLFLPDARGTQVSGIVGLRIDLDGLSSALLPRILAGLERDDQVSLAIVNENGDAVSGSQSAEPLLATRSLGLPFDFWSVAVVGGQADAALASMDFRTKVFLYMVLVLLVAIVAGSMLLVYGLRRESRVANLKTSFISNVSHELRTPLTSIRMYSEMLEMSGDEVSDSERARYLKTIRSECDRLRRLIDAVLDFARMDRGTKRYVFEYEEIGALTRDIGEDFRRQAEARGFEYHVQVDDDLPELRLDADAVRQMLLNLLSNAVKYAHADRYIALRASRQGEWVTVQVEDHGIGIERSEQERIFEDFYRVDTLLSTERGGVGLGLTLARRIAEAHGGRLSVQSVKGQGSTFTVWLPVPRGSEQGAPDEDVATGAHGA